MNNQVSLTTPILVCSVPKAGTHLLRGILQQIVGHHLIRMPGRVMTETHILSEMPLKNKIYFCHLQHSEELSNYISKFPKILLVRDPRDYVVSQAHFFNVLKTEESTLEGRFRGLPSWNIKLSAAILGVEDGLSRLSSVAEMFVNHHIKWLNSPNSFLVRFEDIVGSPFVASYERVAKTIRLILEFIRFTADYDESFLDNIFMGSDPVKSSTFRSGKIGSWRQEFNADHVKQFKLVAPGLVSGLGYEKDENWDLGASTENISGSSNTKINDNEVPRIRKYNPQVLNSIASDNDLSSLTGRYHRLLSIISSSTFPEPIELLNSWAARIFIHNKGYYEALPLIDKLLSNKPDNPHWNYYKAFCLQCIGKDLQEAVKHYSIALENGFGEFWVRYNRGALFRNVGDIDKAYIDMHKALSINPTHQLARDLLEEIEDIRSHPKQNMNVLQEDLMKIRDLINREEYQKAGIQVEDLLMKLPDSGELNYYYAFCLHILGKDLNKALHHYTLGLQDGFDEYWVKYNRGSLLTQLGHLDDAMQDIKRALELKPNDVGATSVLERIEAQQIQSLSDVSNRGIIQGI
ncbi:MAG: sulfotransferase domain-containing protein [Thermoproteota archaeon]|nr:sulfotransferase domain-containing protein [Thermoproteota archaeon]